VVPFVVSPISKLFKFISDCYLHGIISDESINFINLNCSSPYNAQFIGTESGDVKFNRVTGGMLLHSF
jgi:hypothetical protein